MDEKELNRESTPEPLGDEVKRDESTDEASAPTETPSARPRIRFRLWHLLMFAAVAAIALQYFPVFGNTPATFHITEMKVAHDEQWDKHWAILKCRLADHSPDNGETVHCFFAVTEDFEFGGEYGVGDQINFRYQYRDFGFWHKQDPLIVVMRRFFGMELVPEDYGGGLYVCLAEVDGG